MNFKGHVKEREPAETAGSIVLREMAVDETTNPAAEQPEGGQSKESPELPEATG